MRPTSRARLHRLLPAMRASACADAALLLALTAAAASAGSAGAGGTGSASTSGGTARVVAFSDARASVVARRHALVNQTMNLPFSWDTLPRYTFCGNETKNYTVNPKQRGTLAPVGQLQGSHS